MSVPGEADADLKEAVAEIAGVRKKAHCFTQILPHSGCGFAAASPRGMPRGSPMVTPVPSNSLVVFPGAVCTTTPARWKEPTTCAVHILGTLAEEILDYWD